MNFANVKHLTVPEGKVKRVLSGGTVLWKRGYTNRVPLSTEADGKTVYNGALGYKNGYRVRSGGAEAVLDQPSTCTGFIPVKGLSVIRVAGCELTKLANSAINVANASFENIGQVVGNSPNGYGIFISAHPAYNSSTMIQKDGYWQWTVPPDNVADQYKIRYIRVTGATADGSRLIVTVDEEIK